VLPTATQALTPTAVLTDTPTETSTAEPTPTPLLFDAYEPDDVDPPPIAPGELQLHTFYPEGDVDWVVFSVTQDRVYTLRTGDFGTRVDTRIRVEIGGLVFEDDPLARDPSEVTFQAPSDGLAIAKIVNGNPFGYEPPDNTYQLMLLEVLPTPTATATFTPQPTGTGTPTRTITPTRTPSPTRSPTPTQGKDTYEPNSNFNLAYGPLTSETVYWSYIWSSTDDDYFRFNLETPGRIDVELANIPVGSDYDLFLYDPSRREAGRAEGVGDKETISYTAAVTGTYYILIFTPNNTYSREEAYSLRVVYVQPTPTPTNTATPTATFTPVRIPRPPTPTSTPAETDTPTPTSTPSETDTPTPTLSPTVTDTPVPTATPTDTVTATSPTASDTPSSTATAPPTDTPTGTPPANGMVPTG